MEQNFTMHPPSPSSYPPPSFHRGNHMYICTNFDENYGKLKRLYHEMIIFLRTIKLNDTFLCALVVLTFLNSLLLWYLIVIFYLHLWYYLLIIKIVPVTFFKGSVAATVALKTLKGAHLSCIQWGVTEDYRPITERETGTEITTWCSFRGTILRISKSFHIVAQSL